MDIFEKEVVTQDLMESLKKSGDINKYIKNQKFGNNKEFFQYLNHVIMIKEVKKSELIHLADIDRTYGYEILRGDKQPSRNVVLRLLISTRIAIEDIQYILKNTRYSSLYPKNERDAIIIFCINEKYNVMETNKILYDMKHETL